MPGHERIQSSDAHSTLVLNREKIQNLSQTLQKENFGSVLLQRHVLERLPLMSHQKCDYSRKKCVKKSQRKCEGLGTAVQSFFVLNWRINLKPKLDHLSLISH